MPLSSSLLGPRGVVVLAGLAFAPGTAQALTCTVNPAATITLGERQPLQPGFEAYLLVGDYQPDLHYTIDANPEPGASCDNMARGAYYTINHTGKNDAYEQIAPEEVTNDSGDYALGRLNKAGNYSGVVTLSCACGILGGPSANVNVGPILIPPTIQAKQSLVKSGTTSEAVPNDQIPVGQSVDLLYSTEEAALCTGETMTLTLDGAGVHQVFTGNGNDDCNGGAVAGLYTFTPTSTGQMTLIAEYQGLKSNVVTFTVVAGAGGSGSTSGSSGSTGSTTGSSDGGKKVGCSSADGATMLPLLLAVLGLSRRRQR